jgi:hypothetical protein
MLAAMMSLSTPERGLLGHSPAAEPFNSLRTPSICDAARFRQCLIGALKSRGPLGDCVHVHGIRAYTNSTLILQEDGLAGAAVRDGELFSLFSHTLNPHRPCLSRLVQAAVDLGAWRLDAFDTELPRMYVSCGFRAVARMGFDVTSAPGGWDYEFFSKYAGGRPDVVFMVHQSVDSRAIRGLETMSEWVPRVEAYADGIRSQYSAMLSISGRCPLCPLMSAADSPRPTR